MKSIKRVSIVLVSVLLTVCICSVNAQERDGNGGGRGRHGNKHGYHSKEHGHKRDLASKVYSLTDADSVQRAKMKPYVDKASKRIEVLRANYEKQEAKVLDSLKIRLKPILKEDQLKKLDDFSRRKAERTK